MQKIGLFGGTFNPIHNGHLFIAEYVRTSIGLDTIIFIPSHIPPHKDRCINSTHRLNMVLEATRSNKDFATSTVEIQRDGPSYTIDTLRYFSEHFKDDKLFFIMGMDSFLDIKNWEGCDEILTYHLVIVDRWKSQAFGTREIKDLYGLDKEVWVCRYHPMSNLIEGGCSPDLPDYNIIFLDMPLIDISSSIIRNYISSDISVRYLIQDSVLNYIKNNHLYKE